MSKKSIYLFVTLFVLIVIGMFTFTAMQKKNIDTINSTPTATSTTPLETYGISRIDGKHYFINGVHTVVGEVAFPTPCDLLTTNSEVAAGTPNTVKLNFNVINNSSDCAKIVTNQRFSIAATSTKDSNFEGYFMGSRIELNLTEALPGEKPEEFEVFIKA